MALFPNQQDRKYSGNIGKTHTNLVVSEGNAPAEQFTVAKDNGADPFIYEFGPEGNQTVLIAKGKIVEPVGSQMNRETGFRETALKVAGAGSIKAIGVNHHNVYEQRRDAMEGNRPTVITRSYIEVPLFESKTLAAAAATAKAMHFGAAYAETLEPGDFVMAGEDGNFTKYTGDNPLAIIGQVFAVDKNLPPSGFLQFYTGLKSDELEKYLEQISATPVAGDGGYPYGAPYTVGAWRKKFVEEIAGGNLKGIPFLTDGYFKAKELLEVKLTEEDKVEATRAGDGVTVTGSTVKADEGDAEGMVIVKLKHKIDPREGHNISAKSTEGDVSKRDLHVDYQNNSVVIYLDAGETLTDLTLTVPSVVNPTAGIPTEWDYKGSVGAARIQLLR